VNGLEMILQDTILISYRIHWFTLFFLCMLKAWYSYPKLKLTYKLC